MPVIEYWILKLSHKTSLVAKHHKTFPNIEWQILLSTAYFLRPPHHPVRGKLCFENNLFWITVPIIKCPSLLILRHLILNIECFTMLYSCCLSFTYVYPFPPPSFLSQGSSYIQASSQTTIKLNPFQLFKCACVLQHIRQISIYQRFLFLIIIVVISSNIF